MRLLFKDPRLPWEGDFPYERLNRKLREAGHAGLGPSSTGQEVKDSLFDLMEGGRVSPDDRLAWDELRIPERRLALDFFMYVFEDAGVDVWDDAVWDLPMPVQMPDFRRLADVEVRYERALRLPSFCRPARAPEPVPIDAGELAVPALDVGPVAINEGEIFGGRYDW